MIVSCMLQHGLQTIQLSHLDLILILRFLKETFSMTQRNKNFKFTSNQSVNPLMKNGNNIWAVLSWQARWGRWGGSPTTSNITGTLFFVFCFVSWLYPNLKTKRTTENRNLQEEPLLALPKSGGLCGSGWLASLLASTASQAATNMSRGFTYRIQQEDNKQ